jgi:hypothetical protein
MAKAFNLRVIAAGGSMVSSGNHLVIDDENRANGGIRTSLTKRLLCLFECSAHELFVSFSNHRFDRCIVVLARRGIIGSPVRPWHSPRY